MTDCPCCTDAPPAKGQRLIHQLCDCDRCSYHAHRLQPCPHEFIPAPSRTTEGTAHVVVPQRS